MNHNCEAHYRRSIRLPNWDYRERGAYFVTICTSERALLFEDADFRSVAEDVCRNVVWARDAEPDVFVVMPNHIHGIIWLPGAHAVRAQQPVILPANPGPARNAFPASAPPVAAPLRGLDLGRRAEAGSLGAIVRTFKAATAKRINNLRGTPGTPVWQRNYYERVIRDERELERAREYILDNPRRWAEDEHNPEASAAGRKRRWAQQPAVPITEHVSEPGRDSLRNQRLLRPYASE